MVVDEPIHTICGEWMINNQGIIIDKLRYKKGKEENMIMISIKRIMLSLLNRLLMYLTLDTLVIKDFHERLSYIPIRKKRNLKL